MLVFHSYLALVSGIQVLNEQKRKQNPGVMMATIFYMILSLTD